MRKISLPGLILVVACQGTAQVVGGPSIDGPFVHENLAVYVVRGKTTDAREYITLEEGLASGQVVVREQGARQGQDQAEVNKLEIENKSDKWLFLQAGDVVQGGKQDRTIQADAGIEPHSKPQPLGAFCVEHGRWRAGAAGVNFSANTAVLGSNSLKLAVQQDANQSKVWEKVAEQQQKALALAPQPAAQQPPALPAQAVQDFSGQPPQVNNVPVLGGLYSTGTYNAIVKDPKIVKEREAFVTTLLPRVHAGSDALGIIVAINGEVLASDVYGSPALFQKLSRKLLDAYALEAVLSRDPKKKDVAAPGKETAAAFLADIQKAQGKDEKLADSSHRRTKETKESVLFEYRPGEAAQPVHSNYLKK